MTKSRLHRNVLALGIVSFFTDFSSEMIYPLLPVFLSATLGAGPAALGLIEGVAETTASLLKLFSGMASDRVKRKKPLVLAGYGLSALMRPMMAFAFAWPHVLVVRFADRIGKGVRTSPRDALLAAYVPPADRGRAYGLQRAMDHLGAVVGPLAAFALLYGAGLPLRTVFLWSAVPGAVAVIVLLTAVREVPGPKPAGPPPKLFGTALPDPFRRYIAIVALFTLGNASDAFLILRAVQEGIHVKYVPLLWGAFHVVKSTLSTPAGALADRWDRKKMIVAGWMVYAATYAAWGFAEGPAWMVALFLVYALYSAATEGAERALVADFVPQSLRGTAFGWFHLAVGISALPASVLFGALYAWRGAPTAFLTAAALALLSSVLLLALKTPRPGDAR
ncbi:MAG TPA: MFS transporter [Candidatus Deferrimicrobiaceae bacterium]